MDSTPCSTSHIGSLFMMGIPGQELEEGTRKIVHEKGICNFILFRKNIASPPQLRQLCWSLYELCAAEGLPFPFIAIDQEGGSVTRLPLPFRQFPDARVLANSATPRVELTNYARVCAMELRSVGINMNLAPVLDVCPASPEFFMERRCLGSDPGIVAQLGCLVIEEMQQNGIAACAKHFPGLGSATRDPHHELPFVNSPLHEIMTADVVPFKEAIHSRVAAIMTSHTVYRNFDARCPATTSPLILTGFLRDTLQFQGVIITDDLEMGAIEKNGHVPETALAAFKAGADLLLICHNQEKVCEAYDSIIAAWRRKEITEERIRQSLARLASIRQRYVDPLANFLCKDMYNPIGNGNNTNKMNS